MRFNRGDLVQTWFDTGAMGAAILYGKVVAAGPKMVRIVWESSLSNRLPQDSHLIELARDQEDARKAIEKTAR